VTSDIEEIRRLHHTYAYLFDSGDFDGFAALFEHGTLHLRGVDDPATGSVAVRRLIDRCVILYDGTPATNHLMHNLVVDGGVLDAAGEGAGAPAVPSSLRPAKALERPPCRTRTHLTTTRPAAGDGAGAPGPHPTTTRPEAAQRACGADRAVSPGRRATCARAR
jgi:hypothetical protein